MNKKIRKQNGFVLKVLPLLFGVLQILPLHVDGTPLTSRQWGTPSDLQPDEIGIGKAQCNQLPEQARNDFYARVAVSVYVEYSF